MLRKKATHSKSNLIALQSTTNAFSEIEPTKNWKKASQHVPSNFHADRSTKKYCCRKWTNENKNVEKTQIHLFLVWGLTQNKPKTKVCSHSSEHGQPYHIIDNNEPKKNYAFLLLFFSHFFSDDFNFFFFCFDEANKTSITLITNVNFNRCKFTMKVDWKDRRRCLSFDGRFFLLFSFLSVRF